MPAPSFRKNLRDEKIAEGFNPQFGTLGPNPTGDRSRGVASKMKSRNAHAETFDSDSRSFYDEAPNAQQAIDAAALTSEPGFSNPADNGFALGFLQNYRQGVQRGLIEPESEIRPDNLARISTQNATDGSMERAPNTAGVFPGQSGTRIS